MVIIPLFAEFKNSIRAERVAILKNDYLKIFKFETKPTEIRNRYTYPLGRRSCGTWSGNSR